LPPAKLTKPKARRPQAAPGRRRGSGRPALFSREEFLAVALRILERDGRAALTMRALAAEMGTGAASFYNYFDNLASLEDEMVAAMLERIPRPDAGSRARLREQLLGTALAYYEILVLHPELVQMAGPKSDQAAAEVLEACLGCAAACGIDLERTGIAFMSLNAVANELVRGMQVALRAKATPRPALATGEHTQRLRKTETFRGGPSAYYRNIASRLLDQLLPELAATGR
jgi:AcrR family transcriptional regulator